MILVILEVVTITRVMLITDATNFHDSNDSFNELQDSFTSNNLIDKMKEKMVDSFENDVLQRLIDNKILISNERLLNIKNVIDVMTLLKIYMVIQLIVINAKKLKLESMLLQHK